MLTFYFFLVILILLLINIHTSHSILCLRGCLPPTPTHPLQLPGTATALLQAAPAKTISINLASQVSPQEGTLVYHKGEGGGGGRKNRMTFHCKLWDTARGFHSTHTHNSNPAQVGPRGARRGRPRNTIPFRMIRHPVGSLVTGLLYKRADELEDEQLLGSENANTAKRSVRLYFKSNSML